MREPYLEKYREKELENYLEQHQESFYRLAYTVVHDRDAALDVVQNAAVQALTHADTLRDPAVVKTWFYRILVNEGLGYLRKNKRYLPVEVMPDDIVVQDPDVARRLDVYRAVSRLSPRLRTVVVLRFYEDMTLPDIARVTGTNLSTVKSRLYKALALLRTEIGED